MAAFDCDVNLQADQGPRPRLFVTYQPLRAVNKGGRYLCTIRNPADTIISYYALLKASKKKYYKESKFDDGRCRINLALKLSFGCCIVVAQLWVHAFGVRFDAVGSQRVATRDVVDLASDIETFFEDTITNGYDGVDVWQHIVDAWKARERGVGTMVENDQRGSQTKHMQMRCAAQLIRVVCVVRVCRQMRS
jgi:hypothetical protein